MLNITEVRVTYGDGKKSEEYGPLRKAEASLLIIVPEGEDGSVLMSLGFNMARAKVSEMIGVTPPAAAETPKAETKPRGRPPKPVEPPPGDGFDPPGEPDAAAGQPGLVPPTDPIVDQGQQSGAATETDTTASSGDDEWGTEPAEVTDKDLTDACTKRAAAMAEAGNATGTVLIRELIGTFNPDPTKKFSLVQIAAGQRKDFLDKLATLK